MRAFMIPEFGDPGTMAERPTPTPSDGQILVRVRVAGVNAMDPAVRAGYAKDWMEHRFPLTPGFDYAGTVEAVGPGVDNVAVGDEVFGAVGKMVAGEGSFAEYVTATAAVAARRPAGLSAEQAAALPTAGGTALAAVDALGATSGDTIAIVGAAGGVGGFATQLAAGRGLRVIGVTKAEHADHVRRLGAAEIVDYTTGDTLVQLRALAPEGVAGIIDVFHDAAGAAALAAAVRDGGAIVSPIAMGLDQALAGGSVAGRVVAAAVDRVGELGDLAASGAISVPVEALPLHRAADAMDRQASRGVRGKLVLIVG
jgi:NADPH:quinone reductase-like Zn-dependent oxidoreductase